MNGPHQGCHEVNWARVIATSPPDMVNTDAMATVYPTVTSRAVATPALAPSPVSTYVMKLPADGSALVNSATVKASSATATVAARIVSGAATPAVAAIDAEPEVEVDPRPDVRDRRGRHVGGTELTGLEVLSALAHHVSPHPAAATLTAISCR